MWNPFGETNRGAAEEDELPFELHEERVPLGPNDLSEDTVAEHVRDALEDVVDPEVGLNIVDLGLVYAIETTGDCIHVAVTATTPACPMAESIRRDADGAARDAVGGDRDVEVHLVFEPAWQPEFISERGCDELRGGGGVW